MDHRIPLLVLLSFAAPALADFHVSPSGSDTNPGSPQKPFATIQKAIEMAQKAQGDAKRVLLHSGTYYNSAVSFTAAHSDLVVQAAPNQKPILCGGIPISQWIKNNHLYYATLPSTHKWDVRLLQVNGQYRPRARYPKDGTLTHLSVFDVPWMSTTYGGWQRKPTTEELTTLKYNPADLPEDLSNAEVTVFHMWDESVSAIQSHDRLNNTLKLTPELGHPPGAFGVKKYCLWNLAAGLTTPGQWYYHRLNNRIVYWPLPGEDMATAQVIVPTQNTIFRIDGAKKLILRNLTLAVTTVPIMTGGFAAGNYPAAIELANTEYCLLDGLTIQNVAGHAIKARKNAKFTRIENCDISFCGAGGIYVSGEKTEIRNNLVHSIGLAYPSSIGINGGGKNSVVAHNEIRNTPYSAMTFGGENTIIESNLITACMKVLHDGAAIYVFGGKNVTLRGNHAYDIVDTGGYGASAYYLDEQCENCTVERNLSVNVAWPSHNHMARNNVIRDNVFITNGDLKITFPRCGGYTFKGNVLQSRGTITFSGANAVTTWARNVLHGAKVITQGLRDYAAEGNPGGPPPDSTLADPLFMDPSKGDYRYKPDSPATRLGLESIDVSTAGRVKQ